MEAGELEKCLEAERALVQPYANATTAKKIIRIGEEMKTARTATDKAVRKVLDRIAEQDALFDRMWAADMRGIKRWQAENPEEREMTWPGRETLVHWLLERLARAEGKQLGKPEPEGK